MQQVALYIHMPFCIKKCAYCDFNSYEKLEIIPRYLSALKREMENYKRHKLKAETVYIGGGTPTVLNETQLYLLIQSIYDCFDVMPGAEFTIEANPGTLTKSKLNTLKRLGVNRLSIGLQAYQDKLLKILGRIHSQKDFNDTYNLAREAGFKNINVDVIFGLPEQSVSDFVSTLEKLCVLLPEHISCYSLIVEPDTPFYELKKQGNLNLPNENDERLMYYHAKNYLQEQGYIHYEISNFAIPGKESSHNIIYWQLKDYLGLGAGAHSFMKGIRFNNYYKPEKYIEAIEKHNSALEMQERLSIKDKQAEFCFLGLRLIKGISKHDFYTTFGIHIHEVYGEAIEKLKKLGLLDENRQYLKLTSHGLDFANDVFIEFLQ